MVGVPEQKRPKRFEGGYLLVGAPKGIPIRIHWTAPVAAVIFGRLNFVPVFWAAFLGLILIHELGHAFIVLRCRKRVTLIELDGTGGRCHWRGELTRIQHVAIAWGGVLAQGLVLIIALLVVGVLGHALTRYGAQLEGVAIRTNLFMIGLNLLPIAPLDGAVAWGILPIVRQALRERLAHARERRQVKAAAKQSLKELEKLDHASALDSAEAPAELAKIVADMNKKKKTEP